ncbi:MAG TPA: hypothetical protein VI728_07170 [Syntrophales bacterium]|nr:hypothetical protein [Syntrophales bacterium]
MIRDDVSDNLIHLSKDTTDLTAANALLSILKEKKLRGGSTFIKGAYTCVCFSEAPIGKLAYILAEPSVNGIRYKPFGIMVGKKWLYERGGRPVIYQPDAEFELLCEGQRFRHVRYEPDKVDFTWEREWRIKTDELELNPDITTVVVPNRDWEDWLQKQHEARNMRRSLLLHGLFGPRSVVKQPWHYLV